MKTITAPVWDANPFGDEEEQALSDKQYKAYQTFYKDLLPRVSGMEWEAGHGTRIYSRDTISDLKEYRVSAFDSKGAVYHVARETIDELMRAEPFPYDGRELKIILTSGLHKLL